MIFASMTLPYPQFIIFMIFAIGVFFLGLGLFLLGRTIIDSRKRHALERYGLPTPIDIIDVKFKPFGRWRSYGLVSFGLTVDGKYYYSGKQAVDEENGKGYVRDAKRAHGLYLPDKPQVAKLCYGERSIIQAPFRYVPSIISLILFAVFFIGISIWMALV